MDFLEYEGTKFTNGPYAFFWMIAPKLISWLLLSQKLLNFKSYYPQTKAELVRLTNSRHRFEVVDWTDWINIAQWIQIKWLDDVEYLNFSQIATSIMCSLSKKLTSCFTFFWGNVLCYYNPFNHLIVFAKNFENNLTRLYSVIWQMII